MTRNSAAFKVLHIGNIANNAYNNVKLLRQVGINADVICYDYYHIMGCPEWEDGILFGGEVQDQFFPEWRAISISNFERPPWFAQGPFQLCASYLIAKNRGARFMTRAYRRLIARANKTDGPTKNFLHHHVLNSAVDKLLTFLIKVFSALKYTNSPIAFIERKLAEKTKNYIWGQVLSPVIIAIFSLVLALLRLLEALFLSRIQHLVGTNRAENIELRKLSAELCSEFERAFPDRSDKLTEAEVLNFAENIFKWRKLVACYDLIQAYATDPIIPMILKARYVAYEHGTIRDIPFENTTVGRLTALSYAKAEAVFITNPDCLMAAKKLGLTNYKYMPHVIDNKYYSQATVPNPVRKVVDAKYILCPARHDFATKGTDIAIRGFADFAKSNSQVSLVMTDWGVDVKRSIDLVEQLGISDRVKLIPPMSIRELISATQSAEAVIDQFFGYFGGIAPTALASGIPLIINIDFRKYDWCHDTPPPHFNATTPEEVSLALEHALACDRAALLKASLLWMEKNYHYSTVIKAHLETYTELGFVEST